MTTALDIQATVRPSAVVGWRTSVFMRHVHNRDWPLIVTRWFPTRHLAMSYAWSWRPVDITIVTDRRASAH